MEEFLEEFFDLSFEKAISEEMLERDYVFPRSKMEDYILQMTSIPYKYYIDYICTHYCGAEIDNASIPQFSNFTDGTTNICKVMRDLGDPGLGYIKLGQALLSDGIDRKIGAYQKYGENHVKCASFHGLTYLIYKSWFLTCLGYIYPDLDEELKQYVISRTLLRNPLFRLVISEAVNNDVNIKKYFGGLSESTQIRRSSSCIHLFNIIAKQCNLEGLHLHRIFFSSDQNEINSYDESPNTETSSSTNSHSNGLQKGSYNYLKSQFRGFSQKENLTDIEINRLFKDCRNGNQDATNQIISLYLRLVAEIARYYSRFGAPLDDLIQEGCLGLLQAIDRFDNTKSSRFEYYAKFWIAQYITTAINSWAYMVRIPLNVISSFQKIQIFKEKYEQQYGHRPASTDIDIDEDMSDKRMDYLNRLPSSLTEITELHEDMDYLENEYSLVDDFEENDYNHYYINKLQDVLSRRDTEIVEAFYGLGDYRGQVNTLEMVGDKFGLTRERCRQVVEKARREMRERSKVVVRDPFRLELTPGINQRSYYDEERRTVALTQNRKQPVGTSESNGDEKMITVSANRGEEVKIIADVKRAKSIIDNYRADLAKQKKDDRVRRWQGEELKSGDVIYYNDKHCVVKKFITVGDAFQLIVEYPTGQRDFISNVNAGDIKLIQTSKKHTDVHATDKNAEHEKKSLTAKVKPGDVKSEDSALQKSNALVIIENKTTSLIFDKTTSQTLYETRGSLFRLNGVFYRFFFSTSNLMIHKIEKNADGVFDFSESVLYARQTSALHHILHKNNYKQHIQKITKNPLTKKYTITVDGELYDDKGHLYNKR